MGNPYLLGNPSLNPFNNPYLNGSNTLQTMEPVALKNEEYANPAGLFSQAHSDPSQHGISKSWANIEGGPNPQVLDYENQAENPLPPLVASSPGTGTCSFNQIDNSYNNTAQTSTTQSPSNTVFDDWEKLLEDETSVSYWKEILE